MIALVFCLLACRYDGFAAAPQTDPRTLAERLYYFDVPGALKENDPAKSTEVRDALADLLGKNGYAFLYYALPPGSVRDSFKEFIQSVENTRLDEQIGPSGGSTSTISKTGTGTFIGFELDTSDAIHTFQQNVATLRLNADGFSRFLSNQEVIPVCAPGNLSCSNAGWMKNLDLSASFNVTSADTRTINAVTQSSTILTPPDPNADPNDPTVDPTANLFTVIDSKPADFTTSITDRHFASTTARYALINRHDIRSVEYRGKWLRSFQANNQMVRDAGREFWNYIKLVLQEMQETGQNGRLTRDSGEKDQYTLWLNETREKLRTAPRNEEEWDKILQEQLDKLLYEMRRIDRDFDSRTQDLSKAYIRYIASKRDLASMLSSGPALTVEYTYSKPSFQPGIHTVKAAYSFSPHLGKGGAANPGIITLNVGADIYHGVQMTQEEGSTSRIRGGQVALQFDRPLGPANSPAQLSIGGTYQYLWHPVVNVPNGATFVSPGVTAATGDQLLLPRGNLFVADATVTIRVARNGVKIPIGVSWASRTDLRKESEFRAHIGLRFDSIPLLLLPGSN